MSCGGVGIPLKLYKQREEQSIDGRYTFDTFYRWKQGYSCRKRFIRTLHFLIFSLTCVVEPHKNMLLVCIS